MIRPSLAIEGNSLSLDDVTDVIQGKVIAGKQEEVKEVKNAYEAYDRIMTLDPYSITDFLNAHKLMTEGLLNEAGKFRPCSPYWSETTIRARSGCRLV